MDPPRRPRRRLHGDPTLHRAPTLLLPSRLLLPTTPPAPRHRHEIHDLAWPSRTLQRDGREPRGVRRHDGVHAPEGPRFHTAFVPSPESFRRVLRLRHNDSAAGLKPSDDTYAVVSRVLGFSAVPRRLRSEDVAPRGTARLLGLDSVSGLKVRPWRDVDGALVVNGVRSECVDIVRDETVVHVMAGVLMDAEFERSLSLQN
ncbi:hypothetical protein D1007_56581 [Hordeum vulgare]|nr:hypothetical protein D1007_56581 [Hordeum vulgare]